MYVCTREKLESRTGEKCFGKRSVKLKTADSVSSLSISRDLDKKLRGMNNSNQLILTVGSDNGRRCTHKFYIFNINCFRLRGNQYVVHQSVPRCATKANQMPQTCRASIGLL